MRSKRSYLVITLWLFCLLSSICAQETVAPPHIGVPQDWSTRHIVFSHDALARHPEVLYREPRVLHQAMQRWQAPNSDVFHGTASTSSDANTSGAHRDWSVSLGKGHISANMSPAKYSFNPAATPDCTNDFVVFGLTVAGVTTGQANLVGFNNLYAGTLPAGLCGAAPNVYFAYNTTTVAGGKITTSPILSVDGTKIAFVESVPGTEAIFHVLTWAPNTGSITHAAPPTMTSLTFSTTANDTSSSPWIDYAADTVYVGSDNGVVNKITGVFRGTPTLVTVNWPVTIGKGALSPPVLDSFLGYLMVGSSNGNLYQIDTTTGLFKSLAVGKTGATNAGLVAAPVVDVTNGTTFVVSSNNGTNAVLVEADTSTMGSIAKANIGQGAAGAPKPVPALYLYEPAFDNQYYSNPSSGLIHLCGTGAADTTPYQYAFAFTNRTMHTTPTFSQQLLTSTAARCTGWTEFYNPNIGGGTDFFFFGLTQDCAGTGTEGCVVERTSNTNLIQATLNGGPTGITVDNYSTAGQASSLYMTAVKLNTAYKFTQNGLQ